MITKPRSEGRKPGTATAPKKYRRRRCQLKTCNRLYPPVRANQRFCSKEHKDEYHFKTESFSRTKAEVLKLVEEKCFAMVEKIARRVFLQLETTPPPALVERVADMILAKPFPQASRYPPAPPSDPSPSE